MSLTAQVAEFASTLQLSAVPRNVQHLAKRSILDGLGLAVAGARSEAARIAHGHLADQEGTPQATVLGTGERTSVRFAAFANGLAIHADDYDDTQLAVATDRVYGLLTHPTAPVLPAVLALAERHERPGTEVLAAYLAGVEVATKTAEAIEPRHYDHGFHSTATLGSIGAAAGAARLMRLDAERMAVAISLGASQAGGLRENFGTMTKPFHAGRAAENGVLAADLASRGFTAARTILEAPRGFFNAAGGGFDAGAVEGRMGNPWTFASPGISIKPHPSGSLTHPAMWAMLALIQEHDLRPEQVARVSVGTNRHMPNALIHHRPTNALEAKFSMEFCMAILLLERRAGLAEFTDAVVNRPDVQELLRRVDFVVDPVAEAAGYHNMTSRIRVGLGDGRTLEAEAAFGKGSPQNPMSDEELAGKFLECAEWGGIPEDRADEVARRILALEEQPSIAAMVRDLIRAAEGVPA